MLTVWENKEGDTRIRRQRLRKRAQFLRDAKLQLKLQKGNSAPTSISRSVGSVEQ